LVSRLPPPGRRLERESDGHRTGILHRATVSENSRRGKSFDEAGGNLKIACSLKRHAPSVN
jgi:hypothetical protein